MNALSSSESPFDKPIWYQFLYPINYKATLENIFSTLMSRAYQAFESLDKCAWQRITSSCLVRCSEVSTPPSAVIWNWQPLHIVHSLVKARCPSPSVVVVWSSCSGKVAATAHESQLRLSSCLRGVESFACVCLVVVVVIITFMSFWQHKETLGQV